jgi:hypothetical protein
MLEVFQEAENSGTSGYRRFVDLYKSFYFALCKADCCTFNCRTRPNFLISPMVVAKTFYNRSLLRVELPVKAASSPCSGCGSRDANINEETKTVGTGSFTQKRHRGVDFAIWRTKGAWLWFLVNPGGEGGMIGASANETQAMHEACLSIEEKLTFTDREPRNREHSTR